MDHRITSINFKIISLNVRGLNNCIKCRKIFKWLHRQTAHCYFLQETFSTEQSINTWRSEWGGNILYSHGSNHSKGVMILVNPGYQLDVIRSIKSKNGRSIILEIKLDNQNLVLANVYTPNDSPREIKFYKDLNQTLCGLSDSNLIIGGEKVSGKLNFYEKLDVLEMTLSNWKRRKLTLLGKIKIVKSVGLSKLIYNTSVLPVPKNFCDQVNKVTFNFIWDNKIAKIKKNNYWRTKKRRSEYD